MKFEYGPEPFTYPDGQPAPGVAVWVYRAGTTTLVPLYADADGVTPLSNPLNTDAGGLLTFYVDAGFYDLSVNGVVFSIHVVDPSSGEEGVPPHEHVQASPAMTWNIEHNFGYLYPSVDVIVDGSPSHPAVEYALNITTLSFASPTSGVAIARR